MYIYLEMWQWAFLLLTPAAVAVSYLLFSWLAEDWPNRCVLLGKIILVIAGALSTATGVNCLVEALQQPARCPCNPCPCDPCEGECEQFFGVEWEKIEGRK